jgi:hypothetical protein
MTDSVVLDRIAARRAELDLLKEELVKRLADVRVERDELVVAERVVERISGQGFGEYLSLAPAPPGAQVGGRSVLASGGAGQAGAAAREADQALRSRLVAQTRRRPVHDRVLSFPYRHQVGHGRRNTH